MAGTSMSGGANRKSTAMKLLNGTLRKDRFNPNEPTPPQLLQPPPMPDGLNAYGQREWTKMSVELSKLGILTSLDISQLECYCREFGNYLECEAQRRKVTVQQDTPKGKASAAKHAKNLFDQSQKHLIQARAIAREFGFTPASRTRIHVPKVEPLDDFDLL